MASEVVKVRRYGPWKGLNEWPAEAGPEHVEDCINVEFDGDVISTRKGRVKMFTGYNVFPGRVVFEDNKTVASGLPPVRTDYTREATDSLTTTSLTAAIGTGAGAGNVDYLYIGFTSPVRSFYLVVGTANTVTATASVSYYGSSGWASATVVSDGTSSAGKTLAVSGTVLMSQADMLNSRSVTLFGERLFWYRVGASATCDGTLTGIYTTLTTANFTLGAVNGIYHWKRQGGDGVVVVGYDLLEPPVARLGILDLRTGYIRPMRIGGQWTNSGPDDKTGPDAHWRFVTLDRFLIACNGYCLLHSDPDDPDMLVPFAQVPLKAGAVQTNQPPSRAKYLAVYGGALYVVEPHRPNVVRMSNPFGFNRDIDTDRLPKAPLEGANIWDEYAWFTASDDAGTPITGLCASGTKLLVFTERSTHAWVGNTANGAQSVLDPMIGCIAPDSIASVEDAIFFLASNGVYSHSGGKNSLLSHAIQKTMERLNRFSLTGAVGVAYHKKSQYRLAVSQGTARENDSVLVYNWRAGWWSKFGLWPNAPDLFFAYPVSAAFSLQDPEFDDLLIECDYSANVYVSDYGIYDSPSNGNVSGLIVFARIGFDDQYPKTIRGVMFQVKTLGGNAISQAFILKDGQDNAGTTSTEEYTPRAGTQQISMSPVESDDTGTVYTDNTFAAGAWTSPTFKTRKTSITSTTYGIGQTGRYFTVAVYSWFHPMQIRGYQADFIKRENSR